MAGPLNRQCGLLKAQMPTLFLDLLVTWDGDDGRPLISDLLTKLLTAPQVVSIVIQVVWHTIWTDLPLRMAGAIHTAAAENHIVRNEVASLGPRSQHLCHLGFRVGCICQCRHTVRERNPKWMLQFTHRQAIHLLVGQPSDRPSNRD